MRYAIWGSKQRANRLYVYLNRNIDFFIDNDISRRGTIHGKPIVSPKDILDWTRLFIFVPENIYAEVVPILLDRGLKEDIDFVSCPVRGMKISFGRLLESLSQYEQEFKRIGVAWNGTVVFFSGLLFRGNPYMDFVVKMVQSGLPLSFVSENYSCTADLLATEYHMDFRFLGITLAMDSDVSIVDGLLDHEIVSSIVNDQVFYNAMLHYRSWCHCKTAENLLTDPSCCMIYAMKRFSELFIKYIHPARVICHGSSIPFHKVFAHVCTLHDLSVGYTHEGIIPGTYVIEAVGEMGHSLPAIFSERFMSLPVSKEEIEHTRKVWDYLFRSKLNRKIQPNNNCLAYINSRLQKEQPTIFFAGQNDIGSHMVPYTEITKKYHSPIFQSSLEAAIYLANICAKYGWNFIYKPHPDYVQSEQADKLPSNTIFIQKGDINALIDIADVTVTILSTTNYNALIRKKPVVMLGYNQTKGKGCTYEAFEKANIEGVIKAALANGFTQEQQDAFLRHMAQCLKYYLYDDLQERPIRYGRPVPKSIDEFYELERLLQANDVREE